MTETRQMTTDEKVPDVNADAADPTVQALAYLGDAVLEVIVRERLVRRGLCNSARLNEAALAYVKATAQSEAVERIIPLLTERENNVYRRGRNAGHGKNVPKSATMAEYRRATGLETLFGQLRLDGESERMKVLFDAAYPDLAMK
ncbi:MAG: ribonuclease III [Clostridia bacterium]|nr:ribonuclease III [Clostridia bacterium]